MKQPNPKHRRRAFILRRWRHLLSLFLVTVGVSIVIAAWLGEKNLSTAAKLPPWVLVVGGSAALLSLMLYVGFSKFIAAVGLKHALALPPYWIGLIVGIAATLAAIINIEVISSEFALKPDTEHALERYMWLLVAPPTLVFVGSILAWPIRWYRKRKWWKAKTTKSASKSNQSGKQLSDWFRNDLAVDSAIDDLLGHEQIAQRMARRLVTPRPPGQVLLGRLGAGKSTIRNFVQEYLDKYYPHAPLSIVVIELWPYETPRAAVEGVLRMVVESLARHVHTSQLNGLPKAYGEAIAIATGVAAWIPRASDPTSAPFELLKRLDDVAMAIDVRLVLWIEDLERFAFGNPAKAAVESGELERLAPIRALLYGLDQLASITVITATSDLFRRFDLEKIARYVERIPEIPHRVARRVVSRARRQWREELTYIDPVPPSSRNKLGWDEQDEDPPLGMQMDSINSLAVAVSSLGATPRVLKQGLLRCDEIWQHLRGEIDLDDVLAMSILREAVPDVFALVEKHIANLCGLALHRKREADSPSSEVEIAIRSLGLATRIEEASVFVVQSLFRNKPLRPQGLRASRHANYWSRFMTLPELAAGEKDQAILKILTDGNSNDIVSLLADPARAGAVEDFAMMLSNRRLHALFLPLIAARLNDNPATWEKGRYAPGLNEYCGILSKRRNDFDPKWLEFETEKALQLAVAANLGLLYEVVHCIAPSGSSEDFPLLQAPARATLQVRARELLRDHYTDKPQMLAERLVNIHQLTLWWLSWGLERIRSRQMHGDPFEGWPGFARTLLEALQTNGIAVALQIAPFIVVEQRRLHGPDVYIFDEERCAALFGDADRVVEAMRAAVGSRSDNEQIDAVLSRRAALPDEESNSESDEWMPMGEIDSETEVDEVHNKEVASLDEESERETGERLEASTVSVAKAREHIEGYWFESIKEIPASRPAFNATGAIVPEKEHLGDGSICLDLVFNADVWLPLSEAAVREYSHSKAIVLGQPYIFVPSLDWNSIYTATLEGYVERSEAISRFPGAMVENARDDRKSVTLRLQRIKDTEQRLASTNA